MTKFKRLSIIEYINKMDPNYDNRLINFNKILDDLIIKPFYGWDIFIYDGCVIWKEWHETNYEQ